MKVLNPKRSSVNIRRSLSLKQHSNPVADDSSVGRAEDCSWFRLVVILRSMVQIRLVGIFFSLKQVSFFFLLYVFLSM